jgi:hypothetical protein
MRQIVAAYPDDHLGVNTITLDPMWRSPFGANGYMAQSLPILLAIAGRGVAADVRQRGHADAGAVCVAAARDCDPAVAGCGTRALVRQMVLEGSFLFLCAGAVALLLTLWTAKTFARFIPPNSNPNRAKRKVDQYVVWGLVF